MSTTSIEWADSVWNPVVGCTPVSVGCLNCYAATMARRHVGMGTPGYEDRDGIRIAETRAGRAVFTGSVRCLDDRLSEPLRWRKPRRIFVCSMADLFHESVPFAFVDRVFAVAALCPQHQFLILTKRPERMAEYLNENDGLSTPYRVHDALSKMCSSLDDGTIPAKLDPIGTRRFIVPRRTWAEAPAFPTGMPWPLPNVWLGTSVEDQQRAGERIPHLLRCPAAVRFLSVEPLLGPVDIELAQCSCPWPEDAARTRHNLACPADTRRPGDPRRWAALHWVIVGGESGPKARVCCTSWVRSIVEQCRTAGVACFVKQMGSNALLTENRTQQDLARVALGAKGKGGDIREFPPDLRVREWPSTKGGVI